MSPEEKKKRINFTLERSMTEPENTWWEKQTAAERKTQRCVPGNQKIPFQKNQKTYLYEHDQPWENSAFYRGEKTNVYVNTRDS